MSKVVGTIKGKEVRAYDFKDVDVKSISDDEIVITGSTEDQDRDGEVIMVDGWDLKNYKKNPVILAGHDYRQPAIARTTKIWKENGKLNFRIKFPPEGDYPLADVYRKLYKGGFMNASSVGFWPQEWEDGDGQKKPYRTFKKAELLELSLVTVPANPSALVEERGIKEAVKKGVLKSEDIKILKDFIKSAFKEGVSNDNVVKELHVIDGAEIKEEQEEVEGINKNDLGSTEEQGDSKSDQAQIIKEIENIKISINELNEKASSLMTAFHEVQKAVEELKKNLEAQKAHYLDIEGDNAHRGKCSKVSDIKNVAQELFK